MRARSRFARDRARVTGNVVVLAPVLLPDARVPEDTMPSMAVHSAKPVEIPRTPGMRRIVARSHWLRTLGMGLGAVMVGTVFHQRGAHASLWALLVAYGLVWPHVAWWILRRSSTPIALDKRLLMGDVVMGGVWIAAMQFSVLPSVLLATMFAITVISVDGARMLLRALALQVLACCVAGAATGFAFAPVADMVEVLASLPLLVAFPVTLGWITYRLAEQVRRQNRLLLKISSTDALSGLMTRRHWEAAVEAMTSQTEPSGSGCGCAVMLMMDIDHFKHVNDQHGHTAGDEVIRKVGEVIRRGLREGDLAGRYGGDEFAVVLCGADMAVATGVAERIRTSMEGALFELAPGLRCTLSIGLAARPAVDSGVSAWIEQADAALYRAKLAGRNRLALAN